MKPKRCGLHFFLRMLSLICLFACCSCSKSGINENYELLKMLIDVMMSKGTNAPSVFEVVGDETERINRISAIIAQNHALPSRITKAFFLEEKYGDGFMGPSDYVDYYMIEVDKSSLSEWTKQMTPLKETPEYRAPETMRAWWINRNSYKSLRFYNPKIFTGRIHGWIGVSEESGRIYMIGFTT